ncbi:MAG: hypothetical protein KDD67_14310 [Ignavibacteriae bacterium]|nr:hypothetical protein [Ignavibacteriota bacterium]
MHISGNQLRHATLGGLALLLLTFTMSACGSDPAEERVESTSTEMSNRTKVSEEPLTQLPPAATAPTNQPVVYTSKKNSVRKISHTTPKLEPFTQLYRALEKPSERFSIPATKDTTITCAEGTTVKVKAGSFVSARTGKPVTGDVEIEVKEFYRTSDILGANLTTTSGGKMLETGGMLYIGASHDGEECRLKESSSIELGFPYEAAREPGMQLFTGEWGENGVEWMPVSVAVAIGQRIVSESERIVKVNKDTLWGISESDVRQGSLSITRPMATNLNSSDNTFDANYSEEFEKKIANKTSAQVENNNGASTKPQINVDQVEIREVSRYIFSSSQLGWINCDRFQQDNRPKVDFVVDPGTSERLDVKMIFHNMRSILPGTPVRGGYAFKNVPAGEEVTVVALKSVGEEYQIARESGQTSEEGMNNLDFEPVTIDGLRRVMEELGGATLR